jgi:formylglycine-generating enzyme required for sulfatase activity
MPLDPFGMPGCVGRVSPDATVFVAGSGNRATFAMTVPANAALVSLRFFQQALVVDAGAGNAAGAVISEAADAVIGALGSPAASLVAIAAGTFAMGSNAGPPDNTSPYSPQAWERPVHQVTISRPFWIGRTEVTQAEYQAVMGSNPSWFQGPSYPNSASLPVENVTWYEALAYCLELTAREAAAGRLPTGYQYRLPTEAEWEYCCRAGTTTEFHFGSTLVCGQANMWFTFHTIAFCNSTGNCPSRAACNTGTTLVGSYVANAWGLSEMHGNVFEWCLDAWDGSANYPAGAVIDPVVASGAARVCRGGSWFNYSHFCRSAYRSRSTPASRSNDLGFRVVLAPVLVP